MFGGTASNKMNGGNSPLTSTAVLLEEDFEFYHSLDYFTSKTNIPVEQQRLVFAADGSVVQPSPTRENDQEDFFSDFLLDNSSSHNPSTTDNMAPQPKKQKIQRNSNNNGLNIEKLQNVNNTNAAWTSISSPPLMPNTSNHSMPLIKQTKENQFFDRMEDSFLQHHYQNLHPQNETQQNQILQMLLTEQTRQSNEIAELKQMVTNLTVQLSYQQQLKQYQKNHEKKREKL